MGLQLNRTWLIRTQLLLKKRLHSALPSSCLKREEGQRRELRRCVPDQLLSSMAVQKESRRPAVEAKQSASPQDGPAGVPASIRVRCRGTNRNKYRQPRHPSTCLGRSSSCRANTQTGSAMTAIRAVRSVALLQESERSESFKTTTLPLVLRLPLNLLRWPRSAVTCQAAL